MVEASILVASDGLSVDHPSLTSPSDQLPLVADRLREILVRRWRFRCNLPSHPCRPR